MRRNDYFRYSATLTLICLVASLLLVVVHNMTESKLAGQKARQEESSLREVLPLAKAFVPVVEKEAAFYYKALDERNNMVGYAFKAVKKGYSGDIVTLVGMDKDGIISRIKILSHNETPGLGTKVVEVLKKGAQPWFQERFNSKRVQDLKNEVNVITGATITSAAVIDSVQQKAKEILEITKNAR